MEPKIDVKSGNIYSSFLDAHKWDPPSQIYMKSYTFSLLEIIDISQRAQVNLLRKSSSLKYKLFQHNAVAVVFQKGYLRHQILNEQLSKSPQHP